MPSRTAGNSTPVFGSTSVPSATFVRDRDAQRGEGLPGQLSIECSAEFSIVTDRDRPTPIPTAAAAAAVATAARRLVEEEPALHCCQGGRGNEERRKRRETMAALKGRR